MDRSKSFQSLFEKKNYISNQTLNHIASTEMWNIASRHTETVYNVWTNENIGYKLVLFFVVMIFNHSSKWCFIYMYMIVYGYVFR